MRWARRLRCVLALSFGVAGPAAAASALPSWSDQMESLKEVGERLVAEAGRGDTEAHRQEMNRYVLGAVANGYLNYVNADPSHPTWTPLWNYAFDYGGPNPDYAYMFTLVDPRGVYRISGYRGASRFVEITQQLTDLATVSTAKSTFSGTAQTPGAHDLDSLHFDKDGYFSVILSGQRPAGYLGDWWPLDPRTMSLLMRKTSADWRHEIDPRVAIDRLDPAPPPTPEEMARRFSNLKAWVADTIELDLRLVRYYREHHGVNTIRKSELMAGVNAFPTQVYLDGIFELKEGEALVLDTVAPANCRYWQILVADDRFATIDWVNRQSSLNDSQARIDKDGHFRAVISARDPGVPNWLDTAGEPTGVLQMRWNRCSDAPTPQVRKVALAEARKLLPPETPVVTPAERKAQLRWRHEAAQFRRLW